MCADVIGKRGTYLYNSIIYHVCMCCNSYYDPGRAGAAQPVTHVTSAFTNNRSNGYYVYSCSHNTRLLFSLLRLLLFADFVIRRNNTVFDRTSSSVSSEKSFGHSSSVPSLL